MNTWCSLSVINQCNNPLHHPLTGHRQTSVAHARPVCVCVCFFKHKSLSVSCRVLLVICTKRNLVENRGLSVYVWLYVKGRQTRRTFYKRKGDGQLLWPQVCCPNLSPLVSINSSFSQLFADSLDPKTKRESQWAQIWVKLMWDNNIWANRNNCLFGSFTLSVTRSQTICWFDSNYIRATTRWGWYHCAHAVWKNSYVWSGDFKGNSNVCEIR